MTPPVSRWLRWARLAWLAVALFSAAAFFLALPGLLRATPPPPSWPDWTAAEAQQALAQLGWSITAWQGLQKTSVLLPLAYMLLGAFIFWRRPSDPVALLLSAWLLTFLSSGSYTASGALSWAGRVNDSLSTTLFFLVFFVFPNGRFVPRWTRWAALAMAGVQGLRLLRPDWYDPIAFPLVTPFLLAIGASQVYRYARYSGPLQRQQTKWVVFGLAASLSPLIIYLALVAIVPEWHAPTAAGMAALLLGSLLWYAFLIILPLSVTIAILRSRLFDIDIIIRRTLVYAVLSGLLALLYFGSVVVFESLLRGVTGGGSQAAIVLSTLLIAALFGPLRARVQALIDQRFYRRKYDAARTLAAFGASVRDDVDLDALVQRLTAVVDETMQPAHTDLWIRP